MSPATSIVCRTGVGLSACGCFASSSAQLTVTPSWTREAAAARFSEVIRLRAPRSSSEPQRPQLETSSKIACSSSGVVVSVEMVMMRLLRVAARGCAPVGPPRASVRLAAGREADYGGARVARTARRAATR